MIEVESSTSALKPTESSKFIIDRGPFVPGSQINVAEFDLDENKIYDWPVVYILANDREAYVGQTTSAARRINQHGANVEKQDFETVNIIYHDEFNASVVTDYEHRLIGLMHADGRYRLTNKNDGMTESSYFSKAEYGAMFEDLWDEMRSMELASRSIADIEESEVFKYSPYKSLTVDQKVGLDAILSAIRSGLEQGKPIVVEGMPGTGKTVLAIYLMKMLKDDPQYRDLNIRIVEPVTSLRETLRKSLKGVDGFGRRDVIAPTDLVKPEMKRIRASTSFWSTRRTSSKRGRTWEPSSVTTIVSPRSWVCKKAQLRWTGSSARPSSPCSSMTRFRASALPVWAWKRCVWRLGPDWMTLSGWRPR